jgi:hypothetical protein
MTKVKSRAGVPDLLPHSRGSNGGGEFLTRRPDSLTQVNAAAGVRRILLLPMKIAPTYLPGLVALFAATL